MRCLAGRDYCTLDEDWSTDAAFCEPDLRAQAYAQMSQHLEPGTQRIRTKAQYQRLLKRKHRTDDISTKELLTIARDRSKHERVREAMFQRSAKELIDAGRPMIAQLPKNPVPRTEAQRVLLTQLRRVFHAP